MRLDFTGDLALWQGLALAALLVWLAWTLYRRDVRSSDSRWVRLLLPALRCAVVLAVVLCLTGPVLTHRYEEGEVGRVLVFVDGSESMAVEDEHMDAGRKLLVALSRGMVSRDAVDGGLVKLQEAMQEARWLVDSALESGVLRADTALLEAELENALELLREVRPSSLPEVEPETGHLIAEYYDGVPGSTLRELQQSGRLLRDPSGEERVSRFETRRNRGDNYGTRLRGFLHPPLTGSYTFWISSDDSSALFLSDGLDPSRARRVAHVPSYTSHHSWDSSGEQKSAPIELEAGRMYYVEVLHKEGSGEDHCAVGWQRPDRMRERPIPGRYLSPWGASREPRPADVARLASEFEGSIVAQAHALAARNGIDGRQRVSGLETLSAELEGWERRLEKAFSLYVKGLVTSGRPEILGAFGKLDSLSRWSRAEDLLLGGEDAAGEGLLYRLGGSHEVELLVLSGSQSSRLWQSDVLDAVPQGIEARPEGRTTDLRAGIEEATADARDRTAVVLLSDGRHNDGTSPLEFAKLLGERSLPIFPVGLGNLVEPEDLAVLEVDAPASVYAEDRLHGEVLLKDRLPPGRPFALTLSHSGGEVWREELSTTGEGLRKVEFDVPVEQLVAVEVGSRARGMEVLSLPLALDVAVAPIAGEARRDNNSMTFRFRGVLHGRRLLLIDGRPRWETRFIRNLFERDRQWRIETLIRDTREGSSGWSGAEGPVRFPADARALFAHGLVVFGDVPPELFESRELEWLRDFVENRGGAFVFIDGRHGWLQRYEETPLGDLLPVAWTGEADGLEPERLELTDQGLESVALRLEGDPASNTRLWGAFPKPHWVASVRALEGTETYAKAVLQDGTRLPALVLRRFGAGNVLYCSFDSTWRWRYEVADRYHQRYWNQVAAWLMEPPYAVRDEFVSLDAGGPTYGEGDAAALRVRLRDREGKPLLDAHAEALLYRDGERLASVALEPDANRGGVYRGRTAALESGEYEVGVSVEGFSELEMKARATFVVESREARELGVLTCNEELLEAMAAASGGRYLREEDAPRLESLLRPISEGRVVVSEMRLSQSYWWLAPILLLLTLEWLLRKRMGLL